jgi:ABC-2 type transport system permease protein
MPIIDQGYQHWQGRLSGHHWQWLAIARQGVRGQLAVRRVRLLLLGAWMPALTLVTALALWGLFEQGAESVLRWLQPLLPPDVSADPHAYRLAVWTIAYSVFFKVETFFLMVLVLVAGPNLISRDLRFNALPLYLSRPLTRFDYFLGKLGVLAALVAAVTVAPAVVAYGLGVCFSLDLSVVRDTWRLLPASVLYGLLIVASVGPLMLALSSLSRRTLYVGIAWAGLWIISTMVSSMLENVQRATLLHAIAREELGSASFNPHQRHRQIYAGGRWQTVQQRLERAEAQAAPTNWRPLCSYTNNLQRLGEALFGTDAAWVTMGRAVAAPRAALQPFLGGPGNRSASDDRGLADRLVLQYPWTWSAGVLAALLGVSLWTLSIRVKSLDRLR